MGFAQCLGENRETLVITKNICLVSVQDSESFPHLSVLFPVMAAGETTVLVGLGMTVTLEIPFGFVAEPGSFGLWCGHVSAG